MKGRLLLLLCFAILSVNQSQAQNYKWATGGGSTSSLMYSTDWEQVTHMCTDDNRNIYITTTMGDKNIQADTFYMAHAFNPTCCGATPTPHIFIASYNADGKIRWAKLLDAQYFSRSYGIAYDNRSSIYTIGYLFGNNKHLGYDTVVTSDNLTCFIAKYDTSGKFKWVKFIGADSKATRDAAAFQSTLAIDGKGFIHYYSLIKNGVEITPSITSTTGTYDLKYDTSGQLISAIKMPMDTFAYCQQVVFNKKSGNCYANVISVNDFGNLVDAYLTAYDSNDNYIWVDSIRSGFFSDLIYDNNNGLYASAIGNGVAVILDKDTVTHTSANINAFFKLDTLGKIQWHTKLNSSPSITVNSINSIALKNNSQIVATGVITGIAEYGGDTIITPSSEGWNPVFIVIDSSGKLLKLDQFHTDAFYDMGKAATSDRDGNVYIGGWVGDSIFAKGISAYHSHGGETDYFVVKYGYNDGCTLSTEPTPMFSVTGDSTHVPALMNFSYTGSNTPDSVKWVFGDGSTSKALNPSHTYSDTGLIQVCLTVYGCDSGTYCNYITTLKPTSVSNVKVFANLEVYPNPATDVLNIANINKGTVIQLFDIVGSKVYETVASQDKLSIDTHTLHPGAYILMLTNKERQRESLRIVKAE
ncbi:MAG: T9SS type A sorting domain-containing protein [Flavipsychrobacter sp.]